jgi:hypothetical protein
MTVIGGYREGRCCTLPLQLTARATSKRPFQEGSRVYNSALLLLSFFACDLPGRTR